MIEKHVHKYIRVKIGRFKRIEYKCAINGCVHHINVELVVGRESVCHSCGETFYMTKDSAKKSKPKCDICIGRSSDLIKERLRIRELMEKI